MTRRFAATVAKWFDEFWERGALVTPSLIRQARPVWNANAGRRRLSTESFLEILKERPRLASQVKATVIFYPNIDYSKEAKRQFKQLGAGQYNEAQRRINEYEFPMYEDDSAWPVKLGKFYIEFMSNRRNSSPEFAGVWRVRKKNYIIRAPKKDSPKNRIILLDREVGINGLRISPVDAKKMAAAILRYMDKEGRWQTKDRHGSYFEMSFSRFWTTILKGRV